MSTIEYIKQVRDQLGIGLAEAKELIERLRGTTTPGRRSARV